MHEDFYYFIVPSRGVAIFSHPSFRHWAESSKAESSFDYLELNPLQFKAESSNISLGPNLLLFSFLCSSGVVCRPT